MTEAEWRAGLLAGIERLKVLRKSEVAALRKLDIDPDERDERIALIRDWIQTSIADLKAELRT